MEKQLCYVLKLSLEEIALRRIVVDLYKEICNMTSNEHLRFELDLYRKRRVSEYVYKGNLNQREWRETVQAKISQLQLPKSLTTRVKPILKAVGSEICNWMFFHEMYFMNSDYLNVHVLEKLCWTSAGTVDYRKTAEEIVRCDVVVIVTRFELACLYCLESYIPLLWKELPEENKEAFCNEVDSRVETPNLQLLLPYILERESEACIYHQATTVPRNSFELSALSSNKTLAEYYFRGLTKEERDNYLVPTARKVIICRNEDFRFRFYARREKLSDVLCYLLRLMTFEEQVGIFKEMPCEVLKCFLDWPWQDLFWEIADVIWTFLPESKYYDLVLSIYKRAKMSDYYYPNFFHNLYLRSPIAVTKRILDDEILNGNFFWTFFLIDDTESIKVIFRNLNAADRVRLIFSERGLNLIYQWMRKWHVLEVFLQEATLSKENKEHLKEKFIEIAGRRERAYRNSIELVREKNGRFFDFLDESDASA